MINDKKTTVIMPDPNDPITNQATRMMRIFAGNESGHYVTDLNSVSIEDSGKRRPTYLDVKGPPTLKEFVAHLEGKKGLTIIPTTVSGSCKFGVIDLDVYPSDPGAYAAAVVRRGLPLIVSLSKSKGVHLSNYTRNFESAEDMVDKLTEWAAILALPMRPKPPEIFPIQKDLGLGQFGNGINIPYFGGDHATNYALDKDGERMTVDQWLDAIDALPAKAPQSVPGVADVEKALEILAPHWTDGQRDNLNLYVAGALMRTAVEDDKIQELLDGLADISVGSKRPKGIAEVRAADAAGKRVPGFPLLSQLIGKESADAVMKAMGTVPPKQRIELLGLSLEELRDEEIYKERYLIPGLVPVEAYTVIAGALSSYKSFLLLYMIVLRATGYDLLGLTSNEMDLVTKDAETGPCVLFFYEDTDKRVKARFLRIVRDGYAAIKGSMGEVEADNFRALASKNIKRIPLTGILGSTLLIRGKGGAILPNYEFIDEFQAKVRAFTTEGVFMGLDPLRLAILGSQNDDEVAQIGVSVLNHLSVDTNSDSGLVANTHETKVESRSGPSTTGNYVDASVTTSGSMLWSQHARSNFKIARLLAGEIRKLFPDLPEEDATRQQVAKLQHGRLSHDVESDLMYVRMKSGLLVPASPRAQELSLREKMDAALPLIVAAIDRLTRDGVRVSANSIAEDAGVKAKVGALKTVRLAVAFLIDNGYLEATGKTTDKVIAVTVRGRERIVEPSRNQAGSPGQ